jgi:drug/metabolite transporter (DMT)-like permease
MSSATPTTLPVARAQPEPTAAAPAASDVLPGRSKILVALLAVYVIWGSTYFGMKVAVETLPPLTMAGARFLVAGALLYGWLRLRGAKAPTAREWRAAGLVGFLLLTIGNGFVGLALTRGGVSSSLVAVAAASMPLFAALFALRFGEHPGVVEWTGLAVGFIGSAWLALRAGGELRLGIGALFVAIAPASWALGSVWSRRLPLPAGAMRTAAQMLVGGVLLVALGLAIGERVAPSAVSARSLVAWGYLIALGSLVAFSAYQLLLAHTRAALATSYAYVNPVVAVLIGVGLGGERFTAQMALASALVLAGVVAVTTRRRA